MPWNCELLKKHLDRCLITYNGYDMLQEKKTVPVRMDIFTLLVYISEVGYGMVIYSLIACVYIGQFMIYFLGFLEPIVGMRLLT